MRADYYDILEQTQKAEVSLTAWIRWFLQAVIDAMRNAQETLENVLIKNRYWRHWHAFSLNERQKKVLNRLLDHFEGKLTNKKYAALTKVSRDTALRDLTDLVEKRILQRAEGGGRSVSYTLLSPEILPAED